MINSACILALGIPTSNTLPQLEETTANPERHLLFGTWRSTAEDRLILSNEKLTDR